MNPLKNDITSKFYRQQKAQAATSTRRAAFRAKFKRYKSSRCYLSNRAFERNYILITFIPVLMPGFILYCLIQGNIDKALILLSIFCFSLYCYSRSSKIIRTVEGFISRMVWCCILLSVTLVIVAISPEAKNAFAGAVLFLYVPSLLISIFVLNRSRPAKELKEKLKIIYNKY